MVFSARLFPEASFHEYCEDVFHVRTKFKPSGFDSFRKYLGSAATLKLATLYAYAAQKLAHTS